MTRAPPKTNSPIVVVPFERFNKMPVAVAEAQELCSKRVVVVQDHPHHLQFDLDGLEELGDLDELRTMHGNGFL